MALRFVPILVFILFSGLSMTPPADARFRIPFRQVTRLLRVQGTIYCTINGVNSDANTPAFSNAEVQLQCGKGNRVVSNSTTDTSGFFKMALNPSKILLNALLSDCKVTVITPLATCNATLPATGSLQSPLQLMGRTVLGILQIFNIVPSGFTLVLHKKI